MVYKRRILVIILRLERLKAQTYSYIKACFSKGQVRLLLAESVLTSILLILGKQTNSWGYKLGQILESYQNPNVTINR